VLLVCSLGTPGEPLPHQAVDGGEKGCERLARSGRRRDQHMPAGLERGPSSRLRGRGRSKAAVKPSRNGRMKQTTWRHGTGISGDGVMEPVAMPSTRYGFL